MSLFRSHRDDRRRRALAEELAGDGAMTVTAVPSTSKSGAKVARYTSAARREHHRRMSDFVPRSTLALVLWYFGGLTVAVGLLAGYTTWSDPAAMETGRSTAAPLFDVAHGGSLIGWFSSMLFALAAAGSVLIYAVRRHRLDDYRGSYRLWLWSAAAWLVMSIDATANLHTPFSLGMAGATGWSLGGNAAVWWIGAWGMLLSILALRLVLEMRECRTATAAIVMVFALWTATLGVDRRWIPGGEHAVLIAAACRLVGQATLLFSIGFYARHVLLDAEGLLPVRQPKRKREKPAKKTKRWDGDSAKSPIAGIVRGDANKSTKFDTSHQAADKRTDLQPHVLPQQPQASKHVPVMKRGTPIAVDDGDSADDDFTDGGHKLSRAERKRLRKMKRRQERAQQ